jgi:hypothetical protein
MAKPKYNMEKIVGICGRVILCIALGGLGYKIWGFIGAGLFAGLFLCRYGVKK